jgi:hypothetical protein
VYGLFVLLRKLVVLFNCDSSTERGDLTGCLRDLRFEGPSGRLGKSTAGIGFFFICSLQGGIACSCFLRDVRCSGVEFEDFFVWTARGRGSRLGGTYGRLFASSCDVNKRICDPSEG